MRLETLKTRTNAIISPEVVARSPSTLLPHRTARPHAIIGNRNYGRSRARYHELRTGRAYLRLSHHHSGRPEVDAVSLRFVPKIDMRVPYDSLFLSAQSEDVLFQRLSQIPSEGNSGQFSECMSRGRLQL